MQRRITNFKTQFLIRSLIRLLGAAVLFFFLSATLRAETHLQGTAFGDWLIHCIPITESDSDLTKPQGSSQSLECILSQQINFEGSEEPLLKIDLYLNPIDGKPQAVFVLPLGIPLATPPVISFSDSQDRQLRISHCHSDGCYFIAPLSAAFLEAFLSMRYGQVRLRGENNEEVEIPVSGKGSRAAYNYYKAIPKN